MLVSGLVVELCYDEAAARSTSKPSGYYQDIALEGVAQNPSVSSE